MRFRLFFVFCCSCVFCFSQEQLIQDYIENMGDNGQRNLVDFVELYEDYEKRPLNLNTNQEADFHNFPFFTAYQLSQVLYYREQMNGFVEINELKILFIFTAAEIEFLQPLLTVRFVHENEFYSSYNMEQMFRFAQVLEKQVGYEGKLNGSKPIVYFRNKQEWDNRLKLGLTIQKDAGEHLFSSKYRNGFDFVSVSLCFKPKTRHMTSVVVGDYALNFGEGLIIWNGFSMGKGVTSTRSDKNGVALMSYHGSDEVHFMRGASVELREGKFSFIPFFSNKNVDAVIQENAEINSIRVDGYHRTANEIANKGTVEENTYGGRLSFREANKLLAVNFVSINYSKNLVYTSAYQKQYSAGIHHYYTSVNHSLIGQNWQVFGEVAIDKEGNYAMLEGLNLYATPNVTFNSTVRKYSGGYRSLYANSFGERSNANNEIGLYTGVTLNLGRGCSVKSYLDLYSFPSLSYREKKKTDGYDFFVEIRKKLSNSSNIYLRSKYEKRQVSFDKNMKEEVSRLRLHYKTVLGKLTLQSRIETSLYNVSEKGVLVFQDVKAQLRRFTLSTRVAYFDTRSYQSSVYAYQPNFLYAFRSMAYFNQGFQILLMAKIPLSHKLKLWFKYQRVQYLNRGTVGSSYYETTTSFLTEISFQIQFLI